MPPSLDTNPAGAPPTEDTASSALSEQEIADVLGFDVDSTAAAEQIASGETVTPPEPPSGAAKPSEAEGAVPPAPAPSVPPSEPSLVPAATTPTPGSPPAPAATAPSASPPAAPQPADDSALRLASLQATVDALQRELAEARSQPAGAAPATPTAPSSEQPAAEQPYRYALTLPQPVQEALMGDDPAKVVQAINSIVNDLGTIVHNTVIAQVRSEVRSAFQNFAGMATEAQTGDTREQARQKGLEEYYGKFPTHKNELIEPIIRSENMKLSAAYPNAPFDDNYQNALGARVNAALEQLGAKPSEQPTEPVVQPPGAPIPPPRPAAMLPSGNRAAAVTPSGDLSAEIMDTLDPFGGG